jgi:tRNA dimethylallyltransferase
VVDRPVLHVIAGPTAAGKSARALALAKATGGVILNADASQLYADLRVVTARPSADEEAAAEHRLYGVLDAATPASAAWWAQAARAELAALRAAGRVPILVGGTGLYLKALLEGLAPVPPIGPEVRAPVRALPLDEAWAALGREDPHAAARLRPGDSQRIRRALEVVRATGRPLAHWQQQRSGGIAADWAVRLELVDPGREALRARAAARIAAMWTAGAADEVAALLARGLDPGLPVMKAVGVRPLAALLAGRLDRAAASAAWLTETLQLAKRQRTWWRGQGAALVAAATG